MSVQLWVLQDATLTDGEMLEPVIGQYGAVTIVTDYVVKLFMKCTTYVSCVA